MSADEYLPYSRPPLSKDFLRGESEEDVLGLEDGSFYRHHDIEVRLGTRAQALDTGRRVVTLSEGETLSYGWCILATGARPKPLPVPGAEGPGVCYLRSRHQAKKLREAAAAARSAVVVGSGFIGCEAAASLARRGLAVTLVSMEDGPQAARLGDAASQVLRTWLEEDGVSLRLGVEVEAFEGGRVRLAGEASAEGDLLLVAGGVEPEAGLAADAGWPWRPGGSGLTRTCAAAPRVSWPPVMWPSLSMPQPDVTWLSSTGERLWPWAGWQARPPPAWKPRGPRYRDSGLPSVTGRSNTPPGETVTTMPASSITVAERSPSGTHKTVSRSAFSPMTPTMITNADGASSNGASRRPAQHAPRWADRRDLLQAVQSSPTAAHAPRITGKRAARASPSCRRCCWAPAALMASCRSWPPGHWAKACRAGSRCS